MCVTKGALFWLHRYRVLLLLCCLFRKEKKSLLRGAVLPFSVWKEVFILFSFALFLVAAYGGHVYLYTKLLSIVFSFLSYFASSGLFHPPAVCCISYYSRCCIRQRSLICEAFCGVVADVTGPQKRWKITLPFNLLLYFFFFKLWSSYYGFRSAHTLFFLFRCFVAVYLHTGLFQCEDCKTWQKRDWLFWAFFSHKSVSAHALHSITSSPRTVWRSSLWSECFLLSTLFFRAYVGL